MAKEEKIGDDPGEIGGAISRGEAGIGDDVKIVPTKDGGVPIDDIGIATSAEECQLGFERRG